MVAPLKVALDGVRNSLQAEHIAAETMRMPPKSPTSDQAGRPHQDRGPADGDPNDNETLRRFAQAVARVERRKRRADLDPGDRPHRHPRLPREAGGYALISIAICCGSCCAASAMCC
jgi:hypothetical protein